MLFAEHLHLNLEKGKNNNTLLDHTEGSVADRSMVADCVSDFNRYNGEYETKWHVNVVSFTMPLKVKVG